MEDAKFPDERFLSKAWGLAEKHRDANLMSAICCVVGYYGSENDIRRLTDFKNRLAAKDKNDKLISRLIDIAVNFWNWNKELRQNKIECPQEDIASTALPPHFIPEYTNHDDSIWAFLSCEPDSPINTKMEKKDSNSLKK
ncbi:MAG TPA: hypothetical protein DCZ94_09805 [Lentisphaeria bacterium]|nr:MAG: hypothetical protein A2X48_19045 [Lentisphaerae bacterium GWF2_49_21]HBC87237.1 hypothetical protein [Lentisphaeria bacterium]